MGVNGNLKVWMGRGALVHDRIDEEREYKRYWDSMLIDDLLPWNYDPSKKQSGSDGGVRLTPLLFYYGLRGDAIKARCLCLDKFRDFGATA